MKIPEFDNKKELFDFLRKNKEMIISAKKAELKRADAVSFAPTILQADIQKKDNNELKQSDVQVVVVINTTNILDSHGDVHLPGLWKKSLIESSRFLLHLQEHEMCFENVISDGKDLKAYTKMLSWIELGFPFPGKTEALVFESLVRKDRNEFMAEQYRKGFVKNHSVGMRYMKLSLCINDENSGSEFDAWNKYRPEIVNGNLADEKGYFFAVTEAQVIEGSAVPKGSNFVTPTLSVENKNESVERDYMEPPKGTHSTEPVKITPKKWDFLKNININY